jgi:hypothetical protein
VFSITNEKVAGLTPRWARFRGFSLLFDPPGGCLTPSGPCLHLTCDTEADPALGFYKALRDSLARLNPDTLTSAYLFCPLPPPSYHVTVWDGANDGNATFVVSDKRPALERFLAGLPDALAQPQEMTSPALASPLVHREWDIEFRFSHLSIRGALVARLSPTEASEEAFAAFIKERHRLNDLFYETFGVRASENYTPHVSLGYFANREGAQLASPCLREWDALFAERMQGMTLSFQQASLYGFMDMATFFKAAEPLRF